LAGITQAASLVYELANHGNYEQTAFATSIHSIYKIDSESVDEIYHGTAGLRLGLTKLGDLLNYNRQPISKDILRYATGMMMLERKLMRTQQSLTLLRERLPRILSQVDYFSSLHEVVLENLATLYTDVFGKFSFRIVVTGKAEYLQTDDIIHKVRALLLAGIRSAVLWRQLGGTRIQLILHRSKIIKTSQELLLA